MGNWKSAVEISDRYVVGEKRLLAYAERGNLPMRRVPGEAPLFDETCVAKLFRPRSGAIFNLIGPEKPSLGILGVVRLGDRPGEPTTGARHRAVRTATATSAGIADDAVRARAR